MIPIVSKVEQKGCNRLQTGGYMGGNPDLFPLKVNMFCSDADENNRFMTGLVSKHLTVIEFKAMFCDGFYLPPNQTQLLIRDPQANLYEVKQEDASA